MLCGCSRKREPRLAAEDHSVTWSQWRHHCCWFCSALVTWAHRPSQGLCPCLHTSHQTPANGDGRALGMGRRKCCFYFYGPVSAHGFITAQRQLCTQSFGFPFLQHNLHLKAGMCSCVHLLKGGKVGLSPVLALLCTQGWLTLLWWPSWTDPEPRLALPKVPLPPPQPARQSSMTRSHMGDFSNDSLANNFLQWTKTRQLSHCLSIEVSGVLHTTGCSLSVCPHAYAQKAGRCPKEDPVCPS